MTRRISLISVMLAIVLIPTFIMLSFYLSNREIPVEIRTAERLSMTMPDGQTVTAAKDGNNSELLVMLRDMTLDAKSVEKLPDDMKELTPYKVTFYASSSSLVYQYYFGENPAYCYYVEPNQSVRRIVTEKAGAFLSTDFSEPIYSYASPPSISVNGIALTPVTLDWEYRRLDGTYKKATCSVENSGTTPISLGVLTNGISVDCTPTPDQIWLCAVSEAGQTLFEGTPEEFLKFTVKEDMTFTLSVMVEWEKDDAGTVPFAGKALFDMTATMYPPAEFSVSKTEVRPGEVFVLNGIHVSDIESVRVDITPAVDFTPVFVGENGDIKALMTLGFPAGYYSDSTYHITITCPDMSEPAVFAVTIKGQSYESFTDYIKKDVLDTVYTLKSRNDFNDLVQQILAKPSAYSTENGKIAFGQGVLTSDTSRHYAYGTNVTIFATKEEYRALDTMYGVYGASQPVAVADGRVIYVGESTLTGKLLVIDHGNGLRSWYCNLKEISVNAGDVLQMGDVIGTCGGGGFNGQAGINMHVALTLHGQALNLDLAIEDGIVY